MQMYKKYHPEPAKYTVDFSQNRSRIFMHVYPRRAHERPAGAQPAVFT